MDGSPLALPYAGQTFAHQKRADARFGIAETKRQMAEVHRACLVGRGKAKKGSSDGGGKANRIVREI
jgi:hypothetical protein